MPEASLDSTVVIFRINGLKLEQEELEILVACIRDKVS